MELKNIMKERISRVKYLIYAVISAVPQIFFHVVSRLIVFYIYPHYDVKSNAGAIIDIILVMLDAVYIVGMIIILGASVVITLRRLHDLGYSVYIVVVPVIFALMSLFNVSTVWLVLAFQVWLLVMSGERKVNRFGPDPSALTRDTKTVISHSSEQHRVEPLSTVLVRLAWPDDVVAQLKRLAQMRSNGSLSETEFEVMKVHLIGQRGKA